MMLELNDEQYGDMLVLLNIPQHVDSERHNVQSLDSIYYMRNGVKVIYSKDTIAMVDGTFVKVTTLLLHSQTPIAVCQVAQGDFTELFVKVNFSWMSPVRLVKVDDLSLPLAFYVSPSSAIYILNHQCVTS